MKNDKVIQNLYQIQENIGSGLYNIIEDDDEDCLVDINDELYQALEKSVNIITATKELLKYLDENIWRLWDGSWETEDRDGIKNSYSKLKKLIEE